MIVVMNPEATKEQIDRVIDLIHHMDLKEHVIQGTELTVVAVIGEDHKKEPSQFETLPGVQKAMRVLEPYKLASKKFKKERSTVTIGESCVIGGKDIAVIAGPCSVESEEQIIKSAHIVKEAGATALRGGAFKPRTNPYSFQGHGEDGLKMLAAAREATGLPIVTEVMTPTDVALVSRYADCLQIGTRNAQNYKLLEAAGDQPKPVLFKRGMAMTIDEFLQAADYILAAGNPNVILCERGIRTFEKFSRNTYSLSAIVELHHRTHLPVVGDPSHGTGHAHLVPDMAKATLACGADGLALEVHHDPPHAWSDGAQSLNPQQFAELMPLLARVAESVDRSLPLPQAVGQ
ncbi:3-deoxy-7-phosphoheptulonate synthase [Planctomycetales bacterium ZRK34]|nr:3-deoxy-7-phosphoheptulonate synthase [Planctomycetales bacterium ZRK34]